MRILLAEDDPHISVVTQLCLEKIGGHTVTLCTDGEVALETALRQAFDLILLDGMMPKMSGLQVAFNLQAHGVVGTPIIFLSAKTDDKGIEEFGRLGTGYIAKPFDPMMICARIDAILAAHRPPKGNTA